MKRFRMVARETVGEIWIYDVIGDSWDGTTAKGFAADLKALGDVSTLRVYVNSPGGSVFDGVAIYNTLRRHRARKEVTIDGLAASIASVVALAGDEIAIAENGMFMIHDPWTIAAGSAMELRKTADTLEAIRETLIGTYAARSGGDAEEIGNMMAEETWFTAAEALEAGFVDQVIESVEMAALARHDLTPFHRSPTFAPAPAEPRSATHNLLTLARARLAKRFPSAAE